MSDTQLKPPLPDEPITAQGDIPGKVGLAALIGGTVALGVFGGWPILIIVLSLVFMIFMHELGHYLTAKSAGMKVTEFFIGFGPRLWSFRRGETEYGFKAIPAGAYVRIIGMNNLDEVPPADESRTYRQKSYPRRMSVAVAGSTMHFLMAFALGIGSLVLYGSVTEDDSNWEIGQVSTAEETLTGFPADELTPSLTRQLEDGETPALEAGIQEGDRIVAEAFARFPIAKACCVHRLGVLDIGDLAVWVGVTAAHRDAAFAACRYIIDEVKTRVPIWKKEHYAEGDSGWINCEVRSADAPAGSALP